MDENKTIVLLIIIVLALGGILGFRIFADKSSNNTIFSKNNLNNEKTYNDSMSAEEKSKLMEDGMEYSERKTKESQDNMNAQKEKEDIQIVVSMVMFGENSINELTYDGLNEQLKIKFGEGNYKLSGPDDKGNYTIKMNYGTYNIDKSGKVSN